jgi:hypothetical protein
VGIRYEATTQEEATTKEENRCGLTTGDQGSRATSRCRKAKSSIV